MRIAAPEMVMRSRNYKSTNVARQFLSLEEKLSFQINYCGSLKIHIFLERGEKGEGKRKSNLSIAPSSAVKFEGRKMHESRTFAAGRKKEAS
jgi:hypothetical protein